MPLRCAESLRLSARTGRKTHYSSGPLCRKGLAFVAAATGAAAELSLYLAILSKCRLDSIPDAWKGLPLRL